MYMSVAVGLLLNTSIIKIILYMFLCCMWQVFSLCSWFAVHCTSMNNTNKLISGDNKGHASYLMERDMNKGALPGQVHIYMCHTSCAVSYNVAIVHVLYMCICCYNVQCTYAAILHTISFQVACSFSVHALCTLLHSFSGYTVIMHTSTE